MEPPVVDTTVGVTHPLPPKLLANLNPLQRSLRSSWGLILFILIAMFIGTLAVIAFPPIIYLLQYVSSGVFHWPFRCFIDHCVANWLSVMTLMYESFYGIKIRTFGYSGNFKKRSIAFMNHVSHLDWMYYWSVMDRQGHLSYWKVVTKIKPLRNLPIIGHGMQMSNYLFVHRKWELDEEEFRKKLYYLNAINCPAQLLLFPEGGDFTPKTKKLSNEYAKDHDLPCYNYCLHPRMTGFKYTINALRDGGLDAVYDVTIGFPDVFPKTELDVWRGILPKEVHFYIRKYDDKDIPEDQQKLEQWLKDRWREKEERLKMFYTHGEFREVVENQSDSRSSVYKDQKSPEVSKPRNFWFLVYSSFIFLSTNSLIIYCLLYIPYFWTYMIFSCFFLWWGGRKGLGHLYMEFKKKEIEEALKRSKHNYRKDTGIPHDKI